MQTFFSFYSSNLIIFFQNAHLFKIRETPMPASRHSSFTDSTDKLIGLWSSSSDHNQPTNTNQTSATATTTTTPRWRWRAAATRWIASNAIETKKYVFDFLSLFLLWNKHLVPRRLSETSVDPELPPNSDIPLLRSGFLFFHRRSCWNEEPKLGPRFGETELFREPRTWKLGTNSFNIKV